MGVRSLSGLLESHREIYRDELFGTGRLVIDGCNLIKQLYFDSGRSPPPGVLGKLKIQTIKNIFWENLTDKLN